MKFNKLKLNTITLGLGLWLAIVSVASCANQPALKDVLAKDFLIGAALNDDVVSGKDAGAAAIARQQFNTITAENVMKWEKIHPQPDKYDFEPADRFVAFGEKNNMFVVGHTLLWHQQIPASVFEDKDGKLLGRDAMLARMKDHIFTVMGRYKGRVKGWDVVNEALEDEGPLRKTKWIETIGEDFIAKAFEYAHEADPDAELYYNDYSLDKPAKRDAAVRLVKDLKSKGLRIDGVGIQGHWGMNYPTSEELEAFINAIAALGVKVMVTEMDIDVLPSAYDYKGADITKNVELRKELNPYPDGLPDEMQKKLADRYAGLFAIFLKHKGTISRVTLWGVYDKTSWLNNWPVKGRTSYPLLFDRNYQPKPAFDAVIKAVWTFSNPILSGFYPDPSICRVGDDYYLVNSSFEYFPGVPIFHSKDLVHWRQIGYCLTRKSQVPLNKVRASGGIYAPTLRYHDGVFYMVTTNVDGGGNFYVTAQNPAGPWSEPVWFNDGGIDPSLFFDDDGKVYYTRHEGMGDGFIAQQFLNLETGRLEGPLKNIWRGTGGVWPEGPHLYKIRGKYFLVIAEGGTSYDHMVTIARGDSPFGPFESNPKNPILTHRNRPDHPIQALGHADFVETPDGWWTVCLGIRPQGGRFHHLGRETFLAPVTWNSDNWPVVNGSGTLELTMPAPKLPLYSFKEPPARDDFNSDTLALQWNYLRNPYDGDVSLTARPGYLRLNGSAVTLNDQDSPAFVGRRQTDLACQFSARLDFVPTTENEEAGLVIRGNDKNHYDIGVTLRDGKRKAFFRKVLGGKTAEAIQYVDIPDGNVILSVKASPLTYVFSCQSLSGPAINLGKALTEDLSSEKVGGFTGVYLGVYAAGNGQKNTNPADFDYVEYVPDKN
jgi:beta-xylosidase/GH35 family endo-1,4-beta-xylanase